MSTLEVNAIKPISGGTTITFGDSGDTITKASGVNTNAFGIKGVDSWRMATSFTATTGGTQVLTSNLERDDTYQNGKIGTGMSESSGIFTFPETGFYIVSYYTNTNSSAELCRYQVATKIFDITDTSNQKVRFAYDSSHTITVMGSTNGNTTYMTFIRLGDT